MRIVLASDENTVGPLGVCLKSISRSNMSRVSTVYVMCGDVSAAAKDQLRRHGDEVGLDIVLLDVGTGRLREIAGRLPRAHLSFGALLRLTMASILPADVDRVLYIDVDTLVLRDLRSLYDLDLQGAVLAACRTPMAHLEGLGVQREDYFNSGVMLIDLDRWRKDRVEERVFSVISENTGVLQWWDQCALNITLNGRTHPLPRTYNYIFDPAQASDHFELPHILHYAGASKPWPNATYVPWGELYFEMSAGTPWAVRYEVPMSRRRKLGRAVKKIGRQAMALVVRRP